MIGAGVGGFINGLQSKLDGGSYWGGYLGGAISGGLTGLGVSLGPVWAMVGGTLGNFTGTIVTDAINGTISNDFNYWGNLVSDSLLSGLVSLGSFAFGSFTNILKIPGFRDIFVALTILSEFWFSGFSENIKTFIQTTIIDIQTRYGI